MNPQDLKNKIGQLFVISYEELTPPKIIEKLIRERNIGGILLFTANCPTIKQTHQYIEDFKSYASKEPLCVSVDHEGGYVHRLPKPATHFPPMRQLGKLHYKMPSSTWALEVGRVMGRELKAIGFDFDFAPVADVDTNPTNPVIGDRSFSFNAEVVSMAACQIIRGLQETGIAACAKHFPGHGDTSEDSHKVLPRLPHNRKRLESLEWIPFEAAIQEGVASMMTAHVVYEGVDRFEPATFSVKMIRDILREELRFEGVIVSDSLGMDGVLSHTPMEEASVKAFLAGCDLLILGKNPYEVEGVLDYFERAVREGRIPLEQVEKSYQRIARFKERFCTLPPGEQRPPLSVVGSTAHKEILNKFKVFH